MTVQATRRVHSTVATKLISTTKKLLVSVQRRQNIGNFCDTRVAELRFGSQNNEIFYIYDLLFFLSLLNFAPKLLKFGYVLFEHILYARTKFLFSISLFLTLFKNPEKIAFQDPEKIPQIFEIKKALHPGRDNIMYSRIT